MRDLIVKLEALSESKEWKDIVDSLREWQAEKNKSLLEWEDKDYKAHSEAEMIRHEISFINHLISLINVKDKSLKEALIEDLEQSKWWREDRLLGKTHEYGLDIVGDTFYTRQDFTRAENRWIELFNNLPNKLKMAEEEKRKAQESVQQAEIQENLDALSSLEVEGL